MENLQEQFEQIEVQWETIYNNCLSNPSQCAPHLQGADIDDVNEVIKTISHWIKRVSKPRRASGVYRIARGVLATSITSLSGPARHLTTAQYQHFPGFLAQLSQVVTALYSMTILSKEAGTDTVVDLTAEIPTALGALEQATERLNQHLEVCASAEEWKTRAEAAATSAEQDEASASATNKRINTTAQESKTLLQEIQALKTQSDTSNQAINDLAEKAVEVTENIDNYESRITKLITQAEEDQREIARSLPSATSAGLASFFSDHARSLKWPKWGWSMGFIIGIGLLMWLMLDTLSLLSQIADMGNQAADPATGKEDAAIHYTAWRLLLERIPLSAPLIWFAWFCSRNYGHIVRLQEEYAFKAAISRAFEGYKKQMKEIGEAGEQSLLGLLSSEVIQVLARDPQRVFVRKATDDSPFSSVLEHFFPSRRDK